MRAKRIFGLAAFALASLLAAAGRAAAEDGLLLQWKWQKGAILHYRMTQEQHQEMHGPQSMTMSQKQVMLVAQEVKDVTPEGKAIVASTYEAVMLNIDQGVLKIDYDSRKPEDRPKAENLAVRGLAALVGETITYEVDPSGKVGKVEGCDRLMEKAIAGLPEGPQSAAVAAQLRSSFGDAAMRRQLEAALRVLPEKPVARGGTWTQDREQPMAMFGTMKVHTDYDLAGVEPAGAEECAKIGMKCTFAIEPPGEETAGQGIKLALTSGSGTGTILFGREKGRLVRQVLDIVMDMVITVEVPAQQAGDRPAAPQKIEMQQHLAQRTTYEIVDEKEPR